MSQKQHRSSTAQESGSSEAGSARQNIQFGSNSERAQQLQAASDQDKGIYHKPSPIPPIGDVSYYKQRNDDFVKRYAGYGFTPPDYYLEYGDKYCNRFTDEMTPKLSDEGKIWLEKARVNLQVAIEERREQDPVLFDSVEKDSMQFRTFAYDTHPQAYWDAGLGNLGILDLIMIGLTPDVGDLVPWEGISQVADIAVRLGGRWTENAIDGVGAGSALDWVQKKGSEGMNVLSGLIDDQFGARTTENILQSAGNMTGQTLHQAGQLYEGVRRRGIEDIEKTESFLGMDKGTSNTVANNTREAAQDAVDTLQNALEHIWPF